MTNLEELNVWVAELNPRVGGKDFCQVEPIEDAQTGIFHRVRLFTKEHAYCIAVREEKSPGEGGYLGCTVNSRTWRAGEDWHRGNDLADGDFTRETWEKILKDIVSYELVALEVDSGRKAVQAEA